MDKRSTEEMKEWGNWLRAPPRRAAGQQSSKWLRDENDVDWETRVGRSNNSPSFTEEGGVISSKEILIRQNSRDMVQQNIFKAGTAGSNKQIAISKDGPKNNSYLGGLNDGSWMGLI